MAMDDPKVSEFEALRDVLDAFLRSLVERGVSVEALADAVLAEAAPLLIVAYGRRAAIKLLRDLADVMPKEN
jgi:hypothetical protein